MPTIHHAPAGIQVLWGIRPAPTSKPQALCWSSTTAGRTLWLWFISLADQKEPNFVFFVCNYASCCEAVQRFRIEQFSGRTGRLKRSEKRRRRFCRSYFNRSFSFTSSDLSFPALAGVSTEIAAGAVILTIIRTMWRRKPYILFFCLAGAHSVSPFWAFSPFYLLYTPLRSTADSWEHAGTAVELSGSS